MIPKKIHYIWVGGKPLPQKIQDMIEHNKKVLGKGWKINIWTEKDFNINSNDFTKYWYSKKQWAFVSDYMRAYFVNKHGGFYLDTDIKLSKSLDSLTKYNYVASRTYVTNNTMSIFGSKKDSEILKLYMDVISNPLMVTKPPKIMSTHIHTYAISKFHNIPNINKDFINKDIAVLTEDKLQIDVNNKKNIAIHEHHDNWKGTSDLTISKYYLNKVNKFGNESERWINKRVSKKQKLHKKIDKLVRYE